MLGFRRGLRNLATGVHDFLRGDSTAALVTQDAHARFQEAVLNGKVFIGSNPAGTPVTTQAGLSVTTPALTLFNPFASTVNLVLWTVTCNITTPAAAALELAYTFPLLAGVPTAPLTLTNANITNAILGLGTPGQATAITTKLGNQGECYRICTLNATPIAFRYLGRNNYLAGGSAQGGTSVSADSFGWQPGVFPIDGEVVIPPGVSVSIQTSAAVALVASFTCPPQSFAA